MRITTVSRYKVVAAMTRGFFQAFISGNVDATQPGKKEIAPLEYKKIIEGVSKLIHPLFYAQSPDFLKPGLCYFLKFLYL